MLTVVTVILALSFLVFIHELGHFLAAKKVGVHVIEFSIGFPPKVFSKIVGKTEYLISLIPIGGYVRLKGQGIDDEDETDPENYASKTRFQRFLILVSGAMMNLMATLVLLPLVFLTGYEIPAYKIAPPVVDYVVKDSPAFNNGIQKDDLILSINGLPIEDWKREERVSTKLHGENIDVVLKRGNGEILKRIPGSQIKQANGIGWLPKIPPVIGHVFENSQADKAGLLASDKITHINSIEITDWKDISPVVSESKGQPIIVKVIRDNLPMEFSITPQKDETHGSWVIGITVETAVTTENLKDSIVLGVKRAYFLTIRTFEFLYRLIAGQEKSDSVGGPIMIAKMMGEAARTGVGSLLTLVAFISLQFAIFNLLPIPALDGGHIFFLLIEAISGKSLSKNLRMSIQRVGFSLLLLLILYISVQDGFRLFNG